LREGVRRWKRERVRKRGGGPLIIERFVDVHGRVLRMPLCVQNALQELTSDISKLVNLRVLDIDCNHTVKYMPESVSCLQKLEHLHIYNAAITQFPPGLAKLGNLATLNLFHLEGFHFPPDLKVTALPFRTSGHGLVCKSGCGKICLGLSVDVMILRVYICERCRP
jgi:hypothetical protein